MTPKQQAIFNAFNSNGWCAFYFPRKKTISISGGRAKPIKEQIRRMSELLATVPPTKVSDLYLGQIIRD